MSSKTSYEATRKYRKEWEATYPWVKKSSDGTESAFCKLCHVTLKAHKGNLDQHQKSSSHVSRDVSLNVTQKTLFFT